MMARRSRSAGRSADTSDIASSPSLSDDVLNELLRPIEPLPVSPLTRIEEFIGPDLPYDRRVFSFGEPEQYSLSVSSNTRASSPSYGREHIQFSDPSTVSICHRRKERREVLFANRKMRGRGGSRRRSWRSEVKC